MKQKVRLGRLPIIDGPWKGETLEMAVGTFEVEGDEMEFANPLTISPEDVVRVRYYRQQHSSGWVWSSSVPDNASELLQAEAEEQAALLPD